MIRKRAQARVFPPSLLPSFPPSLFPFPSSPCPRPLGNSLDNLPDSLRGQLVGLEHDQLTRQWERLRWAGLKLAHDFVAACRIGMSRVALPAACIEARDQRLRSSGNEDLE